MVFRSETVFRKEKKNMILQDREKTKKTDATDRGELDFFFFGGNNLYSDISKRDLYLSLLSPHMVIEETKFYLIFFFLIYPFWHYYTVLIDSPLNNIKINNRSIIYSAYAYGNYVFSVWNWMPWHVASILKC